MDRGNPISQHRASFVVPALTYSLLLALALGIHTLIHATWSTFIPITVGAITFGSFLHNRQHHWMLSDEQIVARTGILVRHTQVIRLDRITDIRVRTPILASLLGTGAVLVSTAGSDGIELTIFRQHQANKIEAQIARAKRAYIASNPRSATDT